MKRLFPAPFALVLLVATSSPLSRAADLAEVAPGEPRIGWSFRDAARIPIQSGGRVKPLDSFARDLSLFETGSRSFESWEPVDLLFSWISSPSSWEARPFVQVSNIELKRMLGIEEGRSRFSPKELMASHLPKYAADASRPAAPGEKPNPRDAELKRVIERLGTFRAIVSGEAWPVIPAAGESPWKTLAANDSEGEPIRVLFARMVTTYRAGERAGFERASAAAREGILGAGKALDQRAIKSIDAEVTYNHLRPFLIAWMLYVLAALLWTGALSLPAEPAHSRLRRAALAVTCLGLISHVTGIALRCYVAGRPPVSNMYESIIWVSFGVMAFAFILYAMNRAPVLLATACTVATLCLIAADSAPAIMDPGIHPLVPVLRSNYWLTIHVLTITLGYAAFALSLGLGNVTLFQYLRGKPQQAKVQALNQLTYRAIQFGTVLLAAGTILGGIWADYSWGRFWGWDPKETWALIALLAYLAILHARYAGLVNQFTFAAWTVMSFLGVLMAWYGVNFVLGVGLHSYGFSQGGTATVVAFTVIQISYVALSAVARSRALKPASAR
jgi:cytochrome c-type biogenesis protein CcsB